MLLHSVRPLPHIYQRHMRLIIQFKLFKKSGVILACHEVYLAQVNKIIINLISLTKRKNTSRITDQYDNQVEA